MVNKTKNGNEKLSKANTIDKRTDVDNNAKILKMHMLSFEKQQVSSLMDKNGFKQGNHAYKNLKEYVAKKGPKIFINNSNSDADTKSHMLAKLLKKHNVSKAKEQEKQVNKENQGTFQKPDRNSPSSMHKKNETGKHINGAYSCEKSQGDISFENNSFGVPQLDEDMAKLDKLAIINASARFDLLMVRMI